MGIFRRAVGFGAMSLLCVLMTPLACPALPTYATVETVRDNTGLDVANYCDWSSAAISPTGLIASRRTLRAFPISVVEAYDPVAKSIVGSVETSNSGGWVACGTNWISFTDNHWPPDDFGNWRPGGIYGWSPAAGLPSLKSWTAPNSIDAELTYDDVDAYGSWGVTGAHGGEGDPQVVRLFMLDNTAAPVTVSNRATQHAFGPAIGYRYVAYVGDPEGDLTQADNVYIYDMRTKLRSAVTTDRGRYHGSVSVDTPWVAWDVWSTNLMDVPHAVRAKNIATGATKTIAVGDSSTSYSGAKVVGTQVVYSSWVMGARGYEVNAFWAYDLVLGARARLAGAGTTTTYIGPGSAKKPTGNQLVLTQYRYIDDSRYEYGRYTTSTVAVLTMKSTGLDYPTSVATPDYAHAAVMTGDIQVAATKLVGQRVWVETSTDRVHWSRGGSIVSDGTGPSYSLPTRAFTKAGYARIAYDGAMYSPGVIRYFSARGPERPVKPKVSLAVPTLSSAVNAGGYAACSGVLKPRHPSGSKPVKLIYERKLAGAWTYQKTVSATVGNSGSYSRYFGKARLYNSGSWRVKAYYPTSSTNYATTTGWRYFSVK